MDVCENFNIHVCADEDPFTVAGGIGIIVIMPFDENRATIILDPTIKHYSNYIARCKVNGKDSKIYFPSLRDQANSFQMDLKENNTKKITIDGKNCELKLMNIERTGAEYFNYEFFLQSI